MPSLIEKTIAELGDSNQLLLSAKLAELSNLHSEELGFFEQVWATIEPKRRQQIISRLIELAEDNFTLDFDSIFKHCLGDQDAEVRSKAIEGLWENEEPSLIDPLVELLEQDSSEKVQAAAATALGKFAMLAEHNKLRPSRASKVCQALLTVLADKSKPLEVKCRALEAAAPISLPQVEETIKEAYRNGNHKFRVSSIYAMGKNFNPSWLAILVKELSSTDAEIRYEAAGACGGLGEEEAAPHLIRLINDPDDEVQLAAIRALGKIGSNEAKNCLEKCLDNPSEAIQQAAEQALYELEIEGEPLSFSV